MNRNRHKCTTPYSFVALALAWCSAAGSIASTPSTTKGREPVVPPDAKPSPRILYYEENGGLLNSMAQPVPGSARPPMPKLNAGDKVLTTSGIALTQIAKFPQKIARKLQATKLAMLVPQLQLTKTLSATPPANASKATLAETSIPATAPPLGQPFDLIQIVERLAAEQTPPNIRARKIEDAVGSEAIQHRHSAAAKRIGWMWLDGGEPGNAEAWFGHAKQWDKLDDEAARGLALATLAQKKYAASLKWADELEPGSPVAAQTRRGAWTGLGMEAYNANQYPAAIDAFRHVTQEADAPRYVQLLYAWSLLKSGVKQNALAKFESLYRESPDLEAAQGIVAATGAKAIHYDEELKRIEPLASLISAQQAERAFGAKQYLSARALDPQRWGTLGSIGVWSAAAASGVRSKTGDEGLGKLTLSMAPSISIGTPAYDRLAASIYIDRLRLDAGNLTSSAIVGSAPTTVTLPTGLKTQHSIIESEVAVRLEREINVLAMVGNVGQRLAGKRGAYGAIGLSANPDWGQWELTSFTKPVRESMLSWTGMTDPYSATTWGGVTRTGAEFRLLYLRVAPFSVGLNAGAETRTGTQILRNDRRQIGVQIGRDLGLEGFAYSSLGLAYSHDAYQHNLNHYTVGHGGYFSPQQYRKVAASFDFMTEEGKSWLARGRAEAARSSKREDASPYFPLSPDGRSYGGAASNSNESSIRVSAVRQFTPYIQAGLAVSRNKSAQFSESSIQLQLRLTWELRRGVLSTDLPDSRG